MVKNVRFVSLIILTPPVSNELGYRRRFWWFGNITLELVVPIKLVGSAEAV